MYVTERFEKTLNFTAKKVVYLIKISMMKTLRFRTKVSKSGTIQLPKDVSLNEKEVDVIIMPKPKRIGKTMRAMEFVEKWKGFLYPMGSKDTKFDYLMEKYK